MRTKQPILKKVSIDKAKVNNTLLLGTLGVGRAICSFSLSEFDENKAGRYAKLIARTDELRIQVVTVPLQTTQAERDQYVSEGYVKVGKSHTKKE